ncbi:hypothetical protein NQ315_017457, partial [Exocentrus adspersus]
VVENPQVSIRVLSNNLNIKKSSISKCLKENKFHPYHTYIKHTTEITRDNLPLKVSGLCRGREGGPLQGGFEPATPELMHKPNGATSSTYTRGHQRDHVQLHQELLETDFERRVNFCRWIQNVVTENRNFFKFVLFTDECTLQRNGFVNRHNFHYFDTQNPHIVNINNYQHNWTINVWGGIVHNYVIGPHIFEGCVTGGVSKFPKERFAMLNPTCS